MAVVVEEPLLVLVGAVVEEERKSETDHLEEAVVEEEVQRLNGRVALEVEVEEVALLVHWK